jgi:hypothetical protein
MRLGEDFASFRGEFVVHSGLGFLSGCQFLAAPRLAVPAIFNFSDNPV